MLVRVIKRNWISEPDIGADKRQDKLSLEEIQAGPAAHCQDKDEWMSRSPDTELFTPKSSAR